MDTAAAALVRLDQVSKSYKSGKVPVPALTAVTLAVEPGEFLALCGPSGSGKTTVLNLIGALDEADSGDVIVAGQSLRTLDRRRLTLLRRHTIGFIFQSFNLIPVMTALENAEFTLGLQRLPRAERRRRAAEALHDVGLAGLEDRFPGQLSGGQQQRVAIARAIAPRPPLILADEPTANLDSKTAQALIALLAGLSRDKGLTFVFSTHDHRIVEQASRVITLADGAVIDAAAARQAS